MTVEGLSTDIIGRGWWFPIGSDQLMLGSHGRLVTLTNEQNEIEQAICIILATMPGERVMRPEFGSRLSELVFEPNNVQTALQAERYVYEALGRWEPRIEVTAVHAQFGTDILPGLESPQKVAILHLTIHYTIKKTDDYRSLVYPFYLIPEE
jgi:phage baseplate assembly protein W